MAASASTPAGRRRSLVTPAAPVSLPRWCRLLASLILAWGLHAAPKWPAIDPAELADAKPKVEPEAGAEILLREVELDQAYPGDSEERCHVRARIYTERGVEEFTKVDLPYDSGTRIRDIAARTIKPDGTIVELNPKDVFDREIVKTGDVRVKVKSFAPPGVVPGAIVEYRYTTLTGTMSWVVPIIFQRDLPVRVSRFKLRPPELQIDMTIRAVSFNSPLKPLSPDRDGYYRFEMTNLPAAKTEPFQPPEISTTATIIAYYTVSNPLPPDKFWSQLAKELYEKLDSAATVSKPVRAALGGIVAPGDTAEAKLGKIYDFCRTKIVNRDRASTKLSPAQRRKVKENSKPADTLKSGSGTSYDIDVLFAALVRAAGMDAQWAACNDRHWILFESRIAESFMLSDWVIAVRAGDSWRYCDPGATYLPLGILYWTNSDTAVLVGDSKGGSKIATVPGEPLEGTVMSRTADLQLDADGAVEGDVTELYTGQLEASLKFTLDGKTDAEREEYVRQEIQDHQKLAEVTAVTVANAADPVANLKISYHLRIPEFADRTNTRLFFQPAVFAKGVPQRFDAPTRRTPIIFPYRYSERDDLHIKLPAGYTLEEASAPEGLQMGKLGDYDVTILLNKARHELTYRRTFNLKGLAFAVATYPAIKRAFEIIHERDNHTLALRQDADTPPPAPATAPAPADAAPPASPATGPSS